MMRQLERLAPIKDFSGAWCDASTGTSSLMEAISFVTPVLEKFFIHTVAEALAGRRNADADLERRCRTFLREEATHSRAHQRLNAALLQYLGAPPPGCASVQALLHGTRRCLPLSRRLLLAATLEHFTAVLSKSYLHYEQRWDFRCAFTQTLFAEHAREELGHRSVVFDLWLSQDAAGCVGRTLTVAAVLFAGAIYMGVAMSWILHRKTGRHLTGTLSACAGCILKKRPQLRTDAPLRELFLFARGDYHPEHLLAHGAAAASE